MTRLTTDAFGRVSCGGPRATGRVTRLFLVAAAVASLGLGQLPQAHAEDLIDDRDRINSELADSRDDLETFSAELNEAAAALDESKSKLATARKTLAQAQRQRSRAQAKDKQLAADLKAARARLSQAKADVAANQKALDAEAKVIGASVRETHQQNTELMGIAAFVTDAEISDMNQAMQWSTTIFNATQAQMDRLQALHAKLQNAQRAQTKAEQEVAADRAAAAKQLEATHEAEATADRAAATVATLVKSHSAAEDAAAEKVAAEKEKQAILEKESRQVEARVAERVAEQKAKAKAQREAKARQEAAAKAREEADRAEEAAKQAARRRAADAKAKADEAQRAAKAAQRATEQERSAPAVEAPEPATDQGGGWSAPVNGPVTSQFGQRLHPVLKIWKLHDGMDYGAACGTPIVAPRDGVVTESYFNAGYGNRLIVDHGSVDGKFMTTSYNHATHYVVSPGQRVRRGQVLGQVGNTGYSTGCHLHLMTWADGQLVNPADYF